MTDLKAEPLSPRWAAMQRWSARCNGPIFTLLGLFWLLTVPSASGILALRWTLGILFLILGVGTTANYIRVRRSRATPCSGETDRNASR